MKKSREPTPTPRSRRADGGVVTTSTHPLERALNFFSKYKGRNLSPVRSTLTHEDVIRLGESAAVGICRWHRWNVARLLQQSESPVERAICDGVLGIFDVLIGDIERLEREHAATIAQKEEKGNG